MFFPTRLAGLWLQALGRQAQQALVGTGRAVEEAMAAGFALARARLHMAAGQARLFAARAAQVQAAEDQVAAAKSLAGAKSVQEAMELQTTFAKSALEAYIAQMTKASEIVSASIKDSMKPLNERVSAAVEKFQAAR